MRQTVYVLRTISTMHSLHKNDKKQSNDWQICTFFLSFYVICGEL